MTPASLPSRQPDDPAKPSWEEALLDPATLFIAQQAALAAGLSVEAWLARAIRRSYGDMAAGREDEAAMPDAMAPHDDATDRRPSSRRLLIALAVPLAIVIVLAALTLLPQGTSQSGAVAVALPALPATVVELPIAPPPASNAPAEQAPTEPAQLALWLEPRAKRGDAAAQYQLGALYALGKGVDKDYDRAAALLEQAAKSGLPEAQYDFAILCQAGLGVARDPEQAAAWYMRAATQGHPEAALNLGYAYAKGLGVSQDLATAAQWFRRAADRGVVNAQYNLAFLYETGDGVTKSVTEAYAWYSAAAGHGDRGAQQAADRLVRGFTAQQLKDAKLRAIEIAKAVEKNPG